MKSELSKKMLVVLLLICLGVAVWQIAALVSKFNYIDAQQLLDDSFGDLEDTGLYFQSPESNERMWWISDGKAVTVHGGEYSDIRFASPELENAVTTLIHKGLIMVEGNENRCIFIFESSAHENRGLVWIYGDLEKSLSPYEEVSTRPLRDHEGWFYYTSVPAD